MPRKNPEERKEYDRLRSKLASWRTASMRYRSTPKAKAKKKAYDEALRATPEKRQRQRWLDYRRRFGMTIEDRDAMFLLQGSRCASCGSVEPHCKAGWLTDHDHALSKGDPGFIRGIICHFCNLAAHSRATPEWLRAVANYIEKS